MGVYHDVGGGAGHEGGLVGHYVDKWEGSQVRGHVLCTWAAELMQGRWWRLLLVAHCDTSPVFYMHALLVCLCYLSVTLSEIYTVQSVQGFYVFPNHIADCNHSRTKLVSHWSLTSYSLKEFV